jgi:hypothetical protein
VPKSVPHPKPNDGYYVGQWMRDSFYGISNGWSLVNETEQRGFAESVRQRLRLLSSSCPYDV